MSGPPLLTGLRGLSGAPAASPVEPGWPRGTGHAIGPRRTKWPFGRATGSGNMSGAPQIALGDALGRVAGDALTLPIYVYEINIFYVGLRSLHVSKYACHV